MRVRPKVALWIALLAGVYFLPNVMTWITFGYFWPVSHIDHLKNPVQVDGWGENGLRLADGRTVQLPGFSKLPLESKSLSRAVAEGVEVDANGRVFGLMRIWHWCGNDAMRNDVRRIDLGHLLEFMREGTYARKVSDRDLGPLVKGGGFREIGWNISEFVRYRHFVKGDWDWMTKL